jgi:hypothetical protein
VKPEDDNLDDLEECWDLVRGRSRGADLQDDWATVRGEDALNVTEEMTHLEKQLRASLAGPHCGACRHLETKMPYQCRALGIFHDPQSTLAQTCTDYEPLEAPDE